MTEDDHTAPVPTDVAPRTRVLGNRYLLEERIASGGMAAVWRAHDETLARTVAVKILHEHLAADDDLRERFRREAVAAAKLGHPGIVGIYDTGEEDGRTYLVMEYVEGETLRGLMSTVGQLDLQQAAAIGQRVADALAYAHDRDLVHRDVKPANILVSEDGEVKVADFGIAKAAQAARDLTQTGMVLGTAAYVAPEQVRGEPVDGAADQYALACVIYETITGRRPFESESAMTMATRRLEQDPLPLRSLRPDVPKGLDDVIMRALAREPADRHGEMHAFASALSDWAGDAAASDAATGDGDGLEPAGAGTSKPSFLRSEGTWLASVLALVTVAATLVAVGLGTGVLESEQPPILTASDQEASEEAEEPSAEALSLEPEDLALYDPDGKGTDNSESLPSLLDGDPDTHWRPQTSEDVESEGSTGGVGFYVDLGEAHEIQEVLLTTPTPGADIDLRVADEVSDDPDDWSNAARLRDIGTSVRADLGRVEARYLLVYVVPELVSDDDEETLAAVSGLEVRAELP